jgi:hypothetical protein
MHFSQPLSRQALRNLDVEKGPYLNECLEGKQMQSMTDLGAKIPYCDRSPFFTLRWGPRARLALAIYPGGFSRCTPFRALTI